jgi:hypothetical protein
MSSVNFLIGIAGPRWRNEGQTLCFDDLTFTAAPYRRKVDFERGLPRNPRVPLTTQIPGLRFSGVTVHRPAPILNQHKIALNGATSGRAAACSAAARIDFAHPQLAFHTWISPRAIKVGELDNNEVVALGFDSDSNVVAAASVPVPFTVASIANLRYDIRPALVSLESETPIAFVTLTAVDSAGAPRKFYFDDLIFVPAPRIVTFDGILRGDYLRLSDQIPGLRFDADPEVDSYLVRGQIRNSLGLPLSSATSGRDVATSTGTLIQFNNPMLEVSARVSPGFLSFNGHTTAYHTLHLVGYDASGNEIARSATPVLAAAATREEFDAFAPVLVQLQSYLPVTFVTLDWEEDFTHNGSRLHFDDLTFIRAAP